LPAQGRLTQWTPAGFATCLAVAPGGESVATGHADGTILLWDLTLARKALSAPKGDIDPKACWEDLLAEDAGKAYAAIDRLASSPDTALALLQKQLKPETVDARWLAKQLADLDSNDFAVREAATRELKRGAEAVESELRREMAKTSSPEVRRRLEGVLEMLNKARGDVPPPAVIGQLRAVSVLERIGSEQARRLLSELAEGAPDARLTRAAKETLKRLQREARLDP
jgi:hypothetical protein